MAENVAILSMPLLHLIAGRLWLIVRLHGNTFHDLNVLHYQGMLRCVLRTEILMLLPFVILKVEWVPLGLGQVLVRFEYCAVRLSLHSVRLLDGRHERLLLVVIDFPLHIILV